MFAKLGTISLAEDKEVILKKAYSCKLLERFDSCVFIPESYDNYTVEEIDFQDNSFIIYVKGE